MPGRQGVFIYYADAEQFQLLSDQQLGLLIRSLLKYSECGNRPNFDDPAVAMAFSFMAARDDRDGVKYNEVCEKRREAGKKGGRPPKAKGFSENQKVSEESKEKQKKLTPALTPALALTLTPEPEQGRESSAAAPTPPPPAVSKSDKKSEKHKHGEYGWVRLTNNEYARLLKDLGEAELARCIAYIDESAQSNGNKNKWKDWNLVIRRCHRDGWGLGKEQAAQKPYVYDPGDTTGSL